MKGIKELWEKYKGKISLEDFKKIYELGYNQCCDNHRILRGDDAKRFLDNMKRTENRDINPKEKEMLDKLK